MDSSLVGSILQSAGAGTAIIVVLLLLGIISPRSYTTRVEAEADKWYKAWEASRAEVEELRRKDAIQAERTDNAVATAQQATAILERFQTTMGMSHVVEAQTQAHPRRRGTGDSAG